MRLRFLSGASALIAVSLSATAPAAQTEMDCRPWTVEVIATGLGMVENLEPDGTGGLLISSGPRSAIERLTPDGESTTVVEDVTSPGGLRVRGRILFANTGDGAVDGLLGNSNGTIERIDLRTGKRTTYSEGLTMPNGLVFDRTGNAYTSRDIGVTSFITRVTAPDPMDPETEWADLGDTNGLAVDPTNTYLYASTTFNQDAAVYRVALSDPARIELVANIGSILDPLNGLDDMTLGRDGMLYITANGMGRIWKLDPETGESCMIVSGLQNPTSVKFGRGPGWAPTHLFASGWDGRILELVPPSSR